MMPPLAFAAMTMVSAIGAGRSATRDALRAGRSGLESADPALAPVPCFVGRVAALETHRLPDAFAGYDCRNNRLADLALETDGFAAAVAAARDRLGADRIAVILGTSTAGIAISEDAYRHRDAAGRLPEYDYARTHDLYALPRFVRERLGLRGPAIALSAACASSARSFADAAQLIASGIVDAAVVGGVDTLCRTTLHGFASLAVLSADPCRPCDAGRDGISIGEAAGFVLLERVHPGGPRGAIALLGHGGSSDGHHMSAPHPEGTGAALAMRAALARASLPPSAIGYVNLHGTATRANDAMEDRAVAAVFGPGMAVSSTKGWTGHTLGAAGGIEAVIAAIALEDGFLPACLGVATVDPSLAADVLTARRDVAVDRIVSNSFGFGGVNCSLVIGRA